ncbi:AAA family ATPase [Nocardia sp. BMG51109]|uniref:bifunctional aminoglycoside phosphotransferase/ATP-binding protein n=1 Tax=Nocardia sp. BMG51109 TaxID=1056816 RepID=UPI000467117A|nr:AAA family ATPase [Nocardia sp. BMG51109]
MSHDEPFAVLHETHSALVLLCGDRAYKMKKPVVTDFLDFGTRERRERACARELELNRRLAPDVYLGVGELTDPAGGPGEPVLCMRRMPDAARLSKTLADPGAIGHILPDLVHLLTRFHDGADRGPGIDRDATVEALRERWSSLLSGLSEPPITADLVGRLHDRVHRYLDGRKPLFDKRIATGRIVDGHGDLRAGDIFVLPDGFRVLDCLDFDDELRHVDRLDDIAFLAMDLEFRGHPELAGTLVDDYLAGTDDPAPESLRHHYIAYRATVRAKVDCIRHQQGDAEAAEHATRHVDLALRHLDAGAVRLALVGGLPGTGKSTVAQRLAHETGAILLSSDHIRSIRRAQGVLTGPSGAYGAGAYRPGARAQVYSVLRAEARTLLEAGRSVVLDASWTDAGERRRAARLAADTGADLIELQCTAPESVTAERIAARSGGESEATPAIATAMAADRAPWPEADILDTTEPLPDTVRTAVRAWRRGMPL